MEKILYFDICAIIIMVILFASIFLHKMTKGQTNRSFIIGIICCLLTAVFDILSELHGIWLPITPEVLPLRYIYFFGYFMFRNLTAFVYLIYLISLTDNWHKYIGHPWRLIALAAPYTIILIALITNFRTNAIFSFDENMLYVRGESVIILYCCSAAYLAMCLFYIIKYHSLFSKDKLIALVSLLPLTLVAILIQLFYPHMLVEVFATVIALMFVIITVQRPEENVNTVLNVLNYQAHTFDAKRAFYNKKDMDIILIKIVNHSAMLSILGPDVLNLLLKNIISRLQQQFKDLRVSCNIYYLERGLLALHLSGRDMQKTDVLAVRISEMLRQSVVIQHHMLALSSQVCVIHCPKDVEDYQMLSIFETTFHTNSVSTEDVIQASDILQNTNYHLKSELSGILSRAITKQSFDVYYQPIYSLEKKCFSSAEALVRLKDETYGFISPALFIPAAEKNGTIHQIGEFVFEEVCRFIKSPEFTRLGLDYIEINLSVAQCMQTDLAQRLSDIVAKHGIAPEKINLEITETAMEKSREVMEQNLSSLLETGFHFSLDDYGTGYSNIQRIATLPLNIVKLDKTFTDKVHEADFQIILTSTIQMLKALNLEIVVEGVETKEQLVLLEKLGCDYIQGYYFSRPLPKTDFTNFLGQNLTHV